MALFFIERVERVLEIFEEKKRLQAVGKRLQSKTAKELKSLLLVSQETADALKQRDLTPVEMQCLHLFSVEHTFPPKNLRDELPMQLHYLRQQKAAQRFIK